MLTNYFKIAWRNLRKNKVFSFVNILGLSIGIAVCFIILLYVQDEMSYDRFYDKADRTFRVVFDASINGGKISEGNVMPPVAGVLKKDYPEVEEATRLRPLGVPKTMYGNKTMKEGEFVAVDANFFQVFTLPFLKGDAATALVHPNSVVLTKDQAALLFGTEEPMGKVVTFNDHELYTVTGVIDRIPDNAHFHFDFFGSMAGFPEANEVTWMRSNYFTYLVLKEGYDYRKLEAKFPAMVEKYMGPEIKQQMGMDLEQFRTKGNRLGFLLQPLTDIHLHSHTNYEFEPGGDIRYLYIFGAVALFMLLIACINFVNLSTAGASKRAKEVGMRKVMGSLRGELIKQFLLESTLVTLLALLLALVLVVMALPVFNELSGKSLKPAFTINQIVLFLSIGLAVSVLAGAYPAFFLSSFNPITALKNKLGNSTGRFGLRSSLVVFQFFVSVVLITGTIVVHRQMTFISEAKLGYNKEQLLVLPNSWALGRNERVFRDELLRDPRVVNVTISGYKPAGPSYNNNALAYPVGRDKEAMKTLEYKVDERYIPTLGMEMAAGRNFSPSMATDSLGMIINETAVRAFGFNPGNAVGQQIFRQNSSRGDNVVYTVIGVVKDFHFRSLHEAITPLLMVLQPENGLIVKVKTHDMPALLTSMKKQWNSFTSEEPFRYDFMDELYARTYAAEQKTGRILNIFAILTILVACMGLFGLVTYTVEQRSREIGIRKVLGASVTQVTKMLSTEFVKLVLIACLIAFPLSWWGMNLWLQDFAYKTDIGWWVFIVAGAAALLIALLTVSVQAIKAALANPVKTLKTE